MLVVFDLDGTLLKDETPVKLVEAAGKRRLGEQVSKWVKEGKITEEQEMKIYALLLAGMPYKKAVEVSRKIKYRNGAKELVKFLKNRGDTLAIISEGYSLTAERAKKELGFDYAFSNKLEVKNGVLTGRLITPYKDRIPYEKCIQHCLCKRKVLADLMEKLQIESKDVIAIGDGISDWCLLEMAGKSIGFNPDERIRGRVGYIVESQDLRSLLPYL